MRTIIILICIVLVLIFLGGAIDIKGEPIFSHMDRVLHTSMFMNVHYSCFFFLYGDGEEGKARRRVKDFEERPIGIDKKKKYRDLDGAKEY